MSFKDEFPEYEEFERGVAGELRFQRKRANISLKEMSARSGMHSNTLAKCERSEFGLGLDILYAYGAVLDRPVTSFINKIDVMGRDLENPVAELAAEEMLQYSQLIQNIFNTFSEHGIKLNSMRALQVTSLAAHAILENRN